jgi:hypothetical protein
MDNLVGKLDEPVEDFVVVAVVELVFVGHDRGVSIADLADPCWSFWGGDLVVF